MHVTYVMTLVYLPKPITELWSALPRPQLRWEELIDGQITADEAYTTLLARWRELWLWIQTCGRRSFRLKYLDCIILCLMGLSGMVPDDLLNPLLF